MALSGVLCSRPLLISKKIVTVSPSIFIMSLGHPVPRTDLLPNPKVFPPYSPTFLELVLGPENTNVSFLAAQSISF